MKGLFLLGRAVFGGYFVYNAINHFQNHEQMTQYAKAKNVPLPGAAVPLTGALLAIGGASMILGLKPRHGSMALLTFLGGVTPMMHDFWRQQDPAQRQAEMINFSKNVALLGAALALGNARGSRAKEAAKAPETTEVLNKAAGVLKQMPIREQRGRRQPQRAAA